MGCALKHNWEKLAISAISIPHSQILLICSHGMCFETKLRKSGPFCYQHTPQPNLIVMLTWDVFWIKTEKRWPFLLSNIIDVLTWDVLWKITEKSWPFLLSAYPTAKYYWYANMGCVLNQNWEKMAISAISIPHSQNFFISYHGMCFETKLRKAGPFCYQHTPQPNLIDMLTWDVFWIKTEKKWPFLLSAYPTAKTFS